MTKNYIKMCEQAEEIQKEHKFIIEDWYFCINSDTDINNNIRPCAGINDLKIMQNNNGIFWLPTQEQLQNMLLKRSNIFDEYDNVISMIYSFQLWLSGEFYGYYMHKSYPKGNILNELWLAFVMEEIYNKTWTGEKWVKAE